MPYDGEAGRACFHFQPLYFSSQPLIKKRPALMSRPRRPSATYPHHGPSPPQPGTEKACRETKRCWSRREGRAAGQEAGGLPREPLPGTRSFCSAENAESNKARRGRGAAMHGPRRGERDPGPRPVLPSPTAPRFSPPSLSLGHKLFRMKPF